MFFYDRLTWVFILQLNYWRGPIGAWTLYQNIGACPPPRIDAPVIIIILDSLYLTLAFTKITCLSFCFCLFKSFYFCLRFDLSKENNLLYFYV